ncbi:MAG: YciI family protein [Candidatus Limnocylindria bacterium]
MKYALFLYGDESAWDALSPDEQGAVMAEYDEVTRDMERDGVHAGGDALEPSSNAATVRVRDGERIVTDGPFMEAKEMLGGIYYVECGSREEAIAWAARIPDARTGAVEVRPILDLEALEAAANA